MIRVHRIIRRTRAEGPGLRYTLWVQGCHNACPGCYARELWDPAGGEPLSVETLLSEIRATEGVEGITLLGGEPFEQAAPLAELAEAVQAMGLSVLTFTGLTHETLLARQDPGQLALLAHTDLLIDGPYLQEQRDFSRPWVGSANQRYIFLTDRYSMEDVERCSNRIECRVGADGSVHLNGMGDFDALERALQDFTMTRCKNHGIYRF